MKNIILIGFILILLSSCNTQDQRYTQQSAEIDSYKKSLEAYEKMDWEAMANFYADTAKIRYNKLEKDAISLSQLIEMNKKDAEEFSSWDYIDNESEYEMVITDKGETWVNFWGVWQGHYKLTDKTYTIPAHMTARFENGKIVEELGYWDLSKIYDDVNSLLESTNTVDTQ